MTTDWLAIMFQALRSEHGLIVQVNDPAALKRKFYALRKENPELEPLSLVAGLDDANHLWLVKAKPNAPND